MATRQSTIDHLLDQLAGAGDVSAKKMFGEYGLYCDGRIVALVCDDQLYLKPTVGVRAFVGGCEEGCPYPGAKPYLVISGDKWDDREWLVRLVLIAAEEAALPKKKSASRKKKS